LTDDAWILLTSVKPSEAQKNTTTSSSIIEEMLENRVTPLTQFTLTSDNLTQAIITDGEDEKITKIEETTLEVGLSSETNTNFSNETTIATSSSEEEDEDEMTSQMPTTIKPIDETEEVGIEIEEEEEEEEDSTTEILPNSGNFETNISFHARANVILKINLLCNNIRLSIF
jgi:hypothetical protein